MVSCPDGTRIEPVPSVLLTDAMLRGLAPSAKLVEFWDKRILGLCLRASPSGARTWTFRYRPMGSTSFKRLGLGKYPEVGLAVARSRAERKRAEVADGADPQGERKAKREADRRALTFNTLADSYLERYARQHKASWRNDQLYLRAHVRPVWGDRKADKLNRADAAALLDEIAKAAPTSANRTQSILSKLFNWAIESGNLQANPVARMKKRAKENAKDRVLTPDEIRVLWPAIGEGPISESIAAALRLILLTGQRPGEAAGATIAELADIENGGRARLEIPADRMKGRRAHVVPLAPMALQIVREQLSRATLGQEHVFPSHFEERGPIARHSMSQGLRRIIAGLRPAEVDADTIAGLRANTPTPHDFRRTVATGLAALGVPREDRLAVLAHALSDVHGVHYDKYDRMNERRRALEIWEAHVAKIIGLEAPSSNIVKIGARP
jgi:integrase